MTNSEKILDLVQNLSYEEYRTCIKLFQGTGNAEGNIRERPLADKLATSVIFTVEGTQFPVPLEGVKRKKHKVDVLLVNETTVLAVNSKSNGKSNTLSDHAQVADMRAYTDGLKKLFPGKEIVYVLTRNSDVKHGLLPEIAAMNVKEWSWSELFDYVEVDVDLQSMETDIMKLALIKLQSNAQRWFS
jgi:hypothetical protein